MARDTKKHVFAELAYVSGLVLGINYIRIAPVLFFTRRFLILVVRFVLLF